jgi:hypothetical protein
LLECMDMVARNETLSDQRVHKFVDSVLPGCKILDTMYVCLVVHRVSLSRAATVKMTYLDVPASWVWLRPPTWARKGKVRLRPQRQMVRDR